ncbi:coronatine-insensitive protein 1-like protein [Tanacetum coccineum]
MDNNDIKQPRFDTELTDTVFSCVIPYIHPNDLNSVSLVSRKLYELDSMTRKHVTISNCYAVPPWRLVKRFPNLESIKLKGHPPAIMFRLVSFDWGGYITPWVEDIVEKLKRLECVWFKRMIVRDNDLEVLAERCGEKLKVLKLDRCSGFSTDGLLQIAKCCSKLRNLYLELSFIIELDGEWLHELALRNKCIESFNHYLTPLDKYDYADLALLAKNCRESLVSFKIKNIPLKYLVEIFGSCIKIKDFVGDPYLNDDEEDIPYSFPSNIQHITWNYGGHLDVPAIQTFSHQLTKLNLICSKFDSDDHYLILYMSPNLEELYTKDTIGDFGLEVATLYCKKLRRVKIKRGGEEGQLSHVGLTTLAKGCPELECLHVNVKDITNETLECIGANLKKLYDFSLVLRQEGEQLSDLPLDVGVRALLKGCTKLVKLGIHLRTGGITDVGWEYIGKYGQNLRQLKLGFCRDSDAGLVKLSKWCPRLQKLEMSGCDFSQQALATFVLNVTSLRYLWIQDYRAFENGHDIFALARPFWRMELIKYMPLVATQQQPPSLFAYYSLAGQRTDYPDNSVIPLYPYVNFE